MTAPLETIPSKMKAFVLMRHGGFDALEWHENWPTPVAGPTDVLIKVEACGLNNTDVNTRSGWYSKNVTEATTGDAYKEVGQDDPTWGGAPISFPRIQGADVVGTIVSVGEKADTSLLGKRVMADAWLRDRDGSGKNDAYGYFGSECDGGFAEYTKIDYRNVLPVNSDLTSAELATFSCSYTTAENILNRAKVSTTDRVLITGASGGVGSALIQLVKRRGATAIAIASASKHQMVKEIGADFCIARDVSDLQHALEEICGFSSVNVIADVVGGKEFPTLIDTLDREGRYACSGAIAGPIVDLDLRTMYLRDLTFLGCTVTSLNVFPDLVGYIEQEEIKPILAQTYPLQNLREAQQAFIDKAHTGNIVVTIE